MQVMSSITDLHPQPSTFVKTFLYYFYPTGKYVKVYTHSFYIVLCILGKVIANVVRIWRNGIFHIFFSENLNNNYLESTMAISSKYKDVSSQQSNNITLS
jgi:hypothetical protein